MGKKEYSGDHFCDTYGQKIYMPKEFYNRRFICLWKMRIASQKETNFATPQVARFGYYLRSLKRRLTFCNSPSSVSATIILPLESLAA